MGASKPDFAAKQMQHRVINQRPTTMSVASHYGLQGHGELARKPSMPMVMPYD